MSFKPQARPKPPPAGKQKQWWIITVYVPAGKSQQGHIVQTNSPPAVGAAYVDGIVIQVQGPYATEADAAAAAGSSTGTTFTRPGVANPSGQAFPKPSNPLGFLGFLGEIGHWLGVFVTDITDIHMWISLGWLFLGLILLIIGIVLWLKHEDLIPSAVPVPVPV